MKKKLFIKIPITIALIIAFSSCATLEFNSNGFSSSEDAIKNIEKVMRSQGEKFTPNILNVTEEFISYDKERSTHSAFSGWYGSSNTVNFSNTIYYDLIKEIKFIKKKSHYEIRIFSKSSRSVHIIFCWDEELARKGASAIAYMQKNSKK